MERVWGSLAPFTRARCLQNERALFDHLLKDTVGTPPLPARTSRNVSSSALKSSARPRTHLLDPERVDADPSAPRSVSSQGLQWHSHDTRVSDSDPDDVVHSVVIEPAPAASGDEENGAKNPRVDLVLVHGFGNGGGCFFRNVASFGAMGRTHLVDWRGAGMSGRPRSFPPRTYDECVEYLVDGLEAWRASRLDERTRMCLVGHSMGAMIATHYAKRYPSRVAHLVLTGPASVKDDSDPARLANFLQGSLMRRLAFNAVVLAWRAGVTPQAVARWLPVATAMRIGGRYTRVRWRSGDTLDEDGQEVLARYVTGVVRMAPGCSEKVMSVFLKPIGRARRALAAVLEDELDATVPVTFVYGDRDWMSPKSGKECAERMRAGERRSRLKNAEFHLLPNAGHFAFVDQAPAFEAIVRSKWLG